MTEEELRIKYLEAVADYEYEKAKNSEAIRYLTEEMARFYGWDEFKTLSALSLALEILEGGSGDKKLEEEPASLEKRELLEVIDYLQTERKYWMAQFSNDYKILNNAYDYIENLEQQCKKQKEVIDKITDLIKKYGKYDGEKCTRGFQMYSADFNKILDILNEVSE